MGFLADTETAVTTGFTTVANTFGGGLLATFRPAFIIGFTIWITLIAYEVAFGKSQDAFTYLFTKIGKIFLIGVLALYGWPEVSELLQGVRDGFVGAGGISTVLETNLINPMVALWDSLYAWFWAAIADIPGTAPFNLGQYATLLFTFLMLIGAYVLMAFAVTLFGVVALSMYLVANTVFVLLLAIGPFFLLCLAFPFLQRFFETYIGNVMTAILAMAFTTLMVMFVANLFGLTNIQSTVPAQANVATWTQYGKALPIVFLSKAAMALLIIYLYYKVFDLAAALGGGLNMGNNMVGGVRSILSDLQRGGNRGSRNAPGNTIGQGNTAAGGSGGASRQAADASRSFTGMALGAAAPAARMAASGAMNAGRMVGYGAGRATGAVGRFAYNRYSQLSNRNSAS